MSAIVAEPNPVFVDNTLDPPEAAGRTTISYKMDTGDQLWESFDGSPPTQKTGLPAKGSFPVYLGPGRTYFAGVYREGHGPKSLDPQGVRVDVYGVLKKPSAKPLVADHSGAFGGTWVNHGLVTKVATTLALAGVSRLAPTFDAYGWPLLVEPDVTLPKALGPSKSHMFELTPLVPGHLYFLTMVVVDAVGNWEVVPVSLTTLRRKIAVQFKELEVYNDGDQNTTGEAGFDFHVFAPETNGDGATKLADYHTYLETIDGGHSYPLGFTYLEFEPMVVPPTRRDVWVRSDAREHDPAWEPDDYAGGTLGKGRLNLPTGQQENVVHDSIVHDCPGKSGSSFHFGVVVDFSVAYLP